MNTFCGGFLNTSKIHKDHSCIFLVFMGYPCVLVVFFIGVHGLPLRFGCVLHGLPLRFGCVVHLCCLKLFLFCSVYVFVCRSCVIRNCTLFLSCCVCVFVRGSFV